MSAPIPTDEFPARDYHKRCCDAEIHVVSHVPARKSRFLCTLDEGHEGHHQAWGSNLKIAWLDTLSANLETNHD